MGVTISGHRETRAAIITGLKSDFLPELNVTSLVENGGDQMELDISDKAASVECPSEKNQRIRRGAKGYENIMTSCSGLGVRSTTEGPEGGCQTFFVANLPTFVNVGGEIPVASSSDQLVGKELGSPETCSARANKTLTSQERGRRGRPPLDPEFSTSFAKSISFSEKQRHGGPVNLLEPNDISVESNLQLRRRLLRSPVTSNRSLVDTEPASRSTTSDVQSNVGSLGNVSRGSNTRRCHQFFSSADSTTTLKNAKAVLRKHMNYSLMSSLHSTGVHGSVSVTHHPIGVEDDVVTSLNINPLVPQSELTTSQGTSAPEEGSAGRKNGLALVRAAEKFLPSPKFLSRVHIPKNSVQRLQESSISNDCPLVDDAETSVTCSACDDEPTVEKRDKRGKQRQRRPVLNLERTPSSNPTRPTYVSCQKVLSLNGPDRNNTQNKKDEGSSCTRGNQGEDGDAKGDTSIRGKNEADGADDGSNKDGVGWIAIGGGTGIGSKDWYARLRERCSVDDSDD